MTTALPTTEAPDRSAAVAEALAALAHQVAGHGAPLPPLRRQAYGRAHAAFEAGSDQRSRLRSALAASLPPVGPLRVLSVGCGDGALDGALARAALASDPDRLLHWRGVEPLAESASLFLHALRGVPGRGLSVDVEVAAFPHQRVAAEVDVVTMVHCLYYVPDVARALRAAGALLAPHGRVIVAHAPRVGLNELGTLLAPAPEGTSGLWWSESTRAAVPRTGLQGTEHRLVAHVDLTLCRDLADPVAQDVLDFVVQATLPPPLRPPALDVLEALSVSGPDLRVEHPVDVWVLQRDDGEGR